MKTDKLRFLVATDYSETSFSAFYYASELAYKLSAEITLLHVINGSFHTNEAVSFQPTLDAVDRHKERLMYFAVEHPRDHGIKMPKVDVTHDVRFGLPGFTISDYAYDNRFDIIIMGTKGNHGIMDRVLGTASSIAIRTTKCPIILIHKETRYNEPHKVVFGIDNHGDIEDAVSAFHKFNNRLRAKVDFVHIDIGKKQNISRSKEEILEELFEKELPQYSMEIKSISGEAKDKALKDYCLQEKADMLILMHRDDGLFDALFDRSFSIKMAQNFSLPTMVIPE